MVYGPIILHVEPIRITRTVALHDHMPLNHLEERLADVPRDREVVVHCASGYRSSIAASLAERHGLTQSTALVGGFAAWEASQLVITASA